MYSTTEVFSVCVCECVCVSVYTAMQKFGIIKIFNF